jgi:hypothetical protein
VHAEEMAFTVVSMASRRAPVMDGEVVELGHAWIKREQGEIYTSKRSAEAREVEQGNDRVDCNLHPCRR